MIRSCRVFEEAISARLDGAETLVPSAEIDVHIARCRSCRAFAQGAEALARRLRVRPAPEVPDLTSRILQVTIDATAVSAGPPLTRRRQPRRSTTIGIAAAITAVAALAGATLGSQLAGHRTNPAGVFPVAGRAQANPRYPGAVVLPRSLVKPEVTLTDTAGQPFDVARATAGRLTLVYFGYTHCPDVCPVNMALTADALQLLSPADRKQISVVFVTTDPGRDTPTVLRKWLDNFDASFIGLTGTAAQIRQAETEISMPLSYAAPTPSMGYQVVHAAYTLLYSESGTAQLQVDATDTAADVATTLRHLLAYGYLPS